MCLIICIGLHIYHTTGQGGVYKKAKTLGWGANYKENILSTNITVASIGNVYELTANIMPCKFMVNFFGHMSYDS